MSEVQPPAPRVSIITIVRNNRAGLQATRESVGAQTRRDFEWIVIDGASTDDTRQLAEQLFASGEARGVSERDTGIYDAMNKGLERATGEYVVFLNAGDRLLDGNSLGTVITRLDAAGRPDLAFFSSWMDFGGKRVLRPAKPPSYIWHGQPGLHQATFFRTALHQRYPFSTRYRVCGDYDALARMSASGATMRSFEDVIGVNEFEANAMSGRNKTLLIREAVAVQRAELRLPWWKIGASVARRSVNSAAFKLLTAVRGQ